MKYNINVFLHTFEDADTFFNDIYDVRKKYTIYSTHAGVSEYIKNKYNISSIILSSLFEQEEIKKINNESLALSEEIIYNLDSKYSKKISKTFKVEHINYFDALYSYTFPFVLTGLKTFQNALLKLNKNDEYIVFEYKDTFLNSFLLKKYLDQALYKDAIKIQWYKSCKSQTKQSIIKKMLYIYKNLNKVYPMLKETFYEWKSYMSNRNKTILYMEHLYDLRFIKKVKRFRFIPYGYQKLEHKFSFSKKQKIKKNSVYSIRKIFSDTESLLSSFLIDNFLENCCFFEIGLQNLDDLIKKQDINLAIWGNPPIIGFKTLFYAYCQAKNIKVIGMQHGASYVDQNIQQHYYSDFSRCNYYISYGFNQEDLEDNFKNKKILDIKILPYGTTKTFPKNLRANKNIDVLFPVTNTASIFDGGLSRVKPDILHNDQCKILNLLERESQEGIKSLIKPMPQTNLWQTSVFLQLSKLKNISVEYNKTFTNTLLEYSPKCVIIEFMSTPLYEVIDLDVDIFLFVREEDHLTIKAKKMLEKRVYIVENFDEFNVLFQRWKKGKLKTKRDNSFAKHYVKTENAKNLIVKLLENL